MPAIPPPLALLDRSLDSAIDATDALQVICAWPVSGQYGPGTRALYYALIPACVLGRHTAWLRNACLAATLLFPAVAALHCIVLAALHNDGAVDMDVFGTFQFCSTAVLTVPVTVRLSRTYFNEPGRNIIFLWTGLILMGLLSLTVEFYRITPYDCMVDGHPLPKNSPDFIYGETICGRPCSVEDGPSSPLRKEAANNIYVVPAPEKLSFGAATLLSAACCIPAILSIAFMWNKILEINWTRRFGNPNRETKKDTWPLEITELSDKRMINVNRLVRLLLGIIEIPLFSAAVLVIIIVGELNLFSHPVQYQTEPIASIGQWAPIVGAGLAILGSLSRYLAKAVEKQEDGSQVELNAISSSSTHSSTIINNEPALKGDPDNNFVPNPVGSANHTDGMTTNPTALEPESPQQKEIGARYRTFRWLFSASKTIGAAYDTSYFDFKQGPAMTFPVIPGEEQRNIKIGQTILSYGLNTTGDSTSPANEWPSSTMSTARISGDVSSQVGIRTRPTSQRASSPAPSISGNSQLSTSQARWSSDTQIPPVSPSSRTGSRSAPSGTTLEVPTQSSQVYNSRRLSRSPIAPESVPESIIHEDIAPRIVVSSGEDEVLSAQDLERNPHVPP